MIKSVIFRLLSYLVSCQFIWLRYLICVMTSAFSSNVSKYQRGGEKRQVLVQATFSFVETNDFQISVSRFSMLKLHGKWKLNIQLQHLRAKLRCTRKSKKKKNAGSLKIENTKERTLTAGNPWEKCASSKRITVKDLYVSSIALESKRQVARKTLDAEN